jgi:hypothetical protein
VAGILPIPVNDVVQTVNHFIFVDFNREFTPAVEAARSQIEDPKQDEEKVGPLKAAPGFGAEGSTARLQGSAISIGDFDHCTLWRYGYVFAIATWVGTSTAPPNSPH